MRASGALEFFEPRGESASQIVATGLDRGLDPRSQLGGVVLVLRFFFLEQRDIGLDHGDTVVHARYLVVHVANVLLENQLRILCDGDEKTDK